MSNQYFQFKKFIIRQDRTAMKVTTDSCFFGAWAAREMQNEKSKSTHVLDVGCGTGLLSLMILQKNDAWIDAVEINAEAASQAEENINLSPWKNQLQVHQKNIIDFVSEKKYDVIISNPPFYEKELASGNARKKTAHHSADLTMAQLFESIRTLLADDGTFYLMYPFKREKEIESLLGKNGLYTEKKLLLKQSVNHLPFRILLKGSRANVDIGLLEVSIWNEVQQYTSEFVELLRDYYLYL